jgi:UDP-N-acetylglucosamine:LPS N-acetylglucosamine transferase
VESFFSDMQDRLAAAHLVIARSGAGTVTELAVAGRPSILIPLGIAMDDHQTANAEGMVTGAAADVVPEPKFTAEMLAPLLLERISNAGVLRARAKAAWQLGKPERGARTRRPCGAGCWRDRKARCVSHFLSIRVRSTSWALAALACRALPR